MSSAETSKASAETIKASAETTKASAGTNNAAVTVNSTNQSRVIIKPYEYTSDQILQV